MSATDPPGPPSDDAIRTLVARLARPDGSGRVVIERAALLAEGGDFAAILDWITAHAGSPEAQAPMPAKGGLHGGRLERQGAAEDRVPARYVLPVGALD